MGKLRQLLKKFAVGILSAALATTSMIAAPVAYAADNWKVDGVTSNTEGIRYVPKNGYYRITLTSDTQPDVKVADPNVFSVSFLGNFGKEYRYNLSAIGDPKQHTQVIVNGVTTDIDLYVASGSAITSNGYTVEKTETTFIAKGNETEFTVGLKTPGEEITLGTTNNDAFKVDPVSKLSDDRMSRTFTITASGNYGDMGNLTINGVICEPLFQVAYKADGGYKDPDKYIYQRLFYSDPDDPTGTSIAGNIGEWALRQRSDTEYSRELWLYQFEITDPATGNQYPAYCIHDWSRRQPVGVKRTGYNGSSDGSESIAYGSPLYQQMTAALLMGYTGKNQPVSNQWDDYWATQFLLWLIRDQWKDSYTKSQSYNYIENSPDLIEGTVEANIINYTAQHLYDDLEGDPAQGYYVNQEWVSFARRNGHQAGDIDQDFLNAYKKIKKDWYNYLNGVMVRPSFTYGDTDGANSNKVNVVSLDDAGNLLGYTYTEDDGTKTTYKYGTTLTDTNNVLQYYEVSSAVPEHVRIERKGNQLFVMSNNEEEIKDLVLELSIPVLSSEKEYNSSTNELAKLLYKANTNGGAATYWFNDSGAQDQITFDFVEASKQQPTKGYVAFEVDQARNFYGPVRIKKLDENQVNGLPGAGFSVFQTKEDATNETNAIASPNDPNKTIFVTDDNGVTDFDGRLFKGGSTVYVKEVTAPDGYDKIPDVVPVFVDDVKDTQGVYQPDPNNPNKIANVENVEIDGSKYIQFTDKEEIEISKSVQTEGNTDNTAGINQEQLFILYPQVPSGIEKATQFAVTDQIDSRLTYKAGQSVGFVPVDGDKKPLKDKALTFGTDYTVTEPTKDNNNTLTIDVTGAGRAKLAQFGAKYVQITFNASINDTVIENGTDGSNSFGKEIQNQATLKYTNASGTKYEIPTDPVEVHTGAIEIDKADENGVALAGAKFELYKTKEDAQKGINKVSFLTNDPNKDGTHTSEMRDYAVSGKDGKAYIYGVPYGPEVAALDTNVGMPAASKDANNNTTYWVKEVEAPADHVLTTDLIEVTVSGTTPIATVSVVNPKNDEKTLTIGKSVQNLGNNNTTMKIGDPATFILTPSVPGGIENAQQYTITDPIDSRLTFTANQTVSVTAADETGKPYATGAALKEGTDYTITAPDKSNSNTLTVDFTVAGRKTLADANAQCVNITYTAAINRTAVDSSLGKDIPNTATVVFKDSTGADTTAKSNEVEVHTGGAKVVKTASDGTLLAGVEFKIYATEDDAKNDKNALTFMDAKEDSVTSTTTDEDGVAYFYGLPYGPQVTVGSSDKGLSATDADARNTTSYWIVETKTLPDYQLDSKPIQVIVSNVNPLGTVNMTNYKNGEDVPPETPSIGKSVGKPGNTDTTAAINQAVTFYLKPEVPANIADASQYTVTDTIDSRLTFDASQTISVTPADAAGNALTTTSTLSRDRDYQITMPLGSNSNTLTIDFTADGRKALSDMGAASVLITYTASINTSATDSIGVAIPNQATLTYTNKAGVTSRMDSNEVEVHTGAVEVTKTDENEKPLAGAEFQIFSSESDAGALKNPISVINEDGQEVTSVTTGADGKAIFYGLPYGPQVVSPSSSSVTGYAADNTSAGNSTVYYVAESKAPDGYALLEDPIRVVVSGSATTAKVTAQNVLETTPPEKPEHETPSIEKSVGKPGNTDTTAAINQEVPFYLMPEVPKDIAKAKVYTVTDKIDSHLTFTDGQEVTVQPADKDGKAISDKSLEKDSDYKVEVPSKDNDNTLTVDFTADGREALADAKAETVLITFKASLNATATSAIGQKVPNQAHLDYTNSAGTKLDADSNEVEVHTGAIVITKVGTDGAKLKGAQFQVYASQDDAKAKTNPVTFYDAQGNAQTSITTGDDGTATLYGLPYGPQIDEKSQSNGYSASSTDAKNATTYYLVETQAPTGYTLLTDPVAVTVSGSTPTAQVTVENGTTPGGTTPGDTTPGETTPGSTTPGGTTPGGTTPGQTNLTGKTSPQTGDTVPFIGLFIAAAAAIRGAAYFKYKQKKEGSQGAAK